MPRKPLGLRSVRDTAKRGADVPKISIPAWVLGDGLTGLSGDTDVAKDRAEAEQAWPHYRRTVWGHMHVGRVPLSAKTYDGLTTDGADALLRTWQHDVFPLQEVLDALDADRQAVRAFRERDAEGAAQVRDYLARLLAHFDASERAARALADDDTEPGWQRSRPSIAMNHRYADSPIH